MPFKAVFAIDSTMSLETVLYKSCQGDKNHWAKNKISLENVPFNNTIIWCLLGQNGVLTIRCKNGASYASTLFCLELCGLILSTDFYT